MSPCIGGKIHQFKVHPEFPTTRVCSNCGWIVEEWMMGESTSTPTPSKGKGVVQGEDITLIESVSTAPCGFCQGELHMGGGDPTLIARFNTKRYHIPCLFIVLKVREGKWLKSLGK
jgi:hypothetical protein